MGVIYLPKEENPYAGIASIIGTILGQNAQQREVQKGTDYLNKAEDERVTALQAIQENQKAQEELAFKQKIVNANKQWADLDTAGVANDDPRRQDIIKNSQTIRNLAATKGYNLPGQDVDYNTARTMLDTSGRDTTKRLSDAYVKAGYADAANYAPASDTGRDVNAIAPPPAFDLNASMSGLNNIAQLAQAKYTDPNRYKSDILSGLNRIGIGESTMKRLAPLYEANVKQAYDQRGSDLIGQFQMETDPMKKAQLVQQYNSLYGGKVDLKDLAPKTGMATADTSDQINFIKTMQPNAYGIGDASASVVGSLNKGISPGTKAQLNMQEKTLAQNDKHFYANLGLQQQKLQNDTVNDTARIQLAQQNSSLSGFGTLLSDLRGRAGNALKGAQDVIAAHKNNYEENYNPQNDPEVQRYMQDYQAYSKQADTISNRLGSAMGLNTGVEQSGGQGNTTGVSIDYNAAIGQITNALKKNSGAASGQKWNRSQFENYIRQNYGDLSDKLIADTDFNSFGM